MKNRKIWFALPALIISVSVVLIPAIMTIVTSFTDFNGLDLNLYFIGLQNFREIFTDKVFIKALGNNIRWSIIYMSVPVSISLLVAYLLCKLERGRNVFQVIFLIPYVLAAVTNAIIWMNAIYSPVSGLLSVFRSAGVNISSPLSSVSGALYGVAIVDIWHYWGFLMVVFLAAFRQTPYDQVEAALVEGCGGVSLFRYVYFPNILPTFKLMFAMVAIFSFQSFDYIKLMTDGGPARATEMLSTYSYRFAFNMFQFGKAASVAMVMCLFGLFASVIYVSMSSSEEYT